MGLEAQCTAYLDGVESQGKALLETDFLLYRGAASFQIPLPSIESIAVNGPHLRIAWPGHEATFALGEPAAEKWKTRILHPKSILDKLGVKPGMKIAAFHITDVAFLALLDARIPLDSKGQECDILFLGVDTAAGLEEIPMFARRIQPSGALWTVYPKGRKDLTQADVMTASRSHGLVDVKVVSFSPTHTALKWMIPKEHRERRKQDAALPDRAPR